MIQISYKRIVHTYLSNTLQRVKGITFSSFNQINHCFFPYFQESDYLCGFINIKFNNDMYLFKFEPILKQTIWGGHKIITYKNLNSDLQQVGESWELSDIPGHESVVINGPLKGTSLPELINRFGASLVGNENFIRFGNQFPLLVKFIDARKDLSIQVHPDDSLARSRHNCSGKNEMWYVISAEPGARLCSGLSHCITPDEYEQRVASNTIEEVLQFHDIHPGDVFNIPSGCVHSIGAGAFLAEIQQTSDITYRIYDFNRRDTEGNLRQLHTELAKDAIDYSLTDNSKTNYTLHINEPVELLSTPYFTTSLYELTEPLTCDYSELDSFIILICTEGSALFCDDKENQTTICQGETVLIPAQTKKLRIIPDPRVKLLESWV